MDRFRIRMLLAEADDPREGRPHELRLTFHEELDEKVKQGPLRCCLSVITLSYLWIKLSVVKILMTLNWRTLHGTPHLAARPHVESSGLSLKVPFLSTTALPLPLLATAPLSRTLSISPSLPFIAPPLFMLILQLLIVL